MPRARRPTRAAPPPLRPAGPRRSGWGRRRSRRGIWRSETSGPSGDRPGVAGVEQVVDVRQRGAGVGLAQLALAAFAVDGPVDRPQDADRRQPVRAPEPGQGDGVTLILGLASWTTAPPLTSSMSATVGAAVGARTTRARSRRGPVGSPCSRRIWFGAPPLPRTASGGHREALQFW